MISHALKLSTGYVNLASLRVRSLTRILRYRHVMQDIVDYRRAYLHRKCAMIDAMYDTSFYAASIEKLYL